MENINNITLHNVHCPDYQEPQFTPLVTAWFVEVGEYLCVGDYLCEITVANVAITIHSPLTGRISRICRNINELTSPGQLLCQISVSTTPPT